MAKLDIVLFFGGKSAEHEISLRSAQNVIDAIDKEKYHLHFIAIDKQGNWNTNSHLENELPPFPLSLDFFKEPVAVVFNAESPFMNLQTGKMIPVDVCFPVLHGPYGEDGTIQGLFRSVQLPFVGADVLGSAVGMDKDVMKRLFRESGIAIGAFITAYRDDVPTYQQVVKKLGTPFYIKPANMGSSVGISKVQKEEDYTPALDEAFKYDLKIVIEENIEGMELECAVLGNRKAKASVVGRIIAYHEFYTYSSKYLDDKGFKLEIPAAISEEKSEEIRALAVKVFEVLDTFGLGRVDVFLKKDGKVLVNEINTMPGFTSISMYPMLWKESGLSYGELIDRLIQLAIERGEDLSRLSTSI